MKYRMVWVTLLTAVGVAILFLVHSSQVAATAEALKGKLEVAELLLVTTEKEKAEKEEAFNKQYRELERANRWIKHLEQKIENTTTKVPTQCAGSESAIGRLEVAMEQYGVFGPHTTDHDVIRFAEGWSVC